MIFNKQLNEWLEHPVTVELLDLIKEHIEATKELGLSTVFDTASIAKVDLTKVAEIRGQKNTLELIVDLKSFLTERSLHEEAHTVGTDGSS